MLTQPSRSHSKLTAGAGSLHLLLSSVSELQGVGAAGFALAGEVLVKFPQRCSLASGPVERQLTLSKVLQEAGRCPGCSCWVLGVAIGLSSLCLDSGRPRWARHRHWSRETWPPLLPEQSCRAEKSAAGTPLLFPPLSWLRKSQSDPCV